MQLAVSCNKLYFARCRAWSGLEHSRRKASLEPSGQLCYQSEAQNPATNQQSEIFYFITKRVPRDRYVELLELKK